MAPYYPEEVDVFSEPHSRMKQLVEDYSEKLSCTDFSDGVALESLLRSLHHTFCEFKCHEYIENKLIMKQLKRRMKTLAVHNTAVCNCHSDNRLSDILELVHDGYSFTMKTVAECINYGVKLQHALEEFTDLFLPHMKEEEEVFQPMLMQYFEYEELKTLKERVIEEHVKWQLSSDDEKCCCEEESNLKHEPTDVQEENLFTTLPPEVIIHILSYLPIPDLLHCSEVCRTWNQFTYDPLLWRNLYPVRWAQGNWHMGMDINESLSPLTGYHRNDLKFFDEDADFDESSDSESSCTKQCGKENCTCLNETKIVRQENKVLTALVKHILPRVGIGVQKIILASCKGLTSSLLHSFLLLCPNLAFLDVSYTNITDAVFKGLVGSGACLNLRHLDLSGCIGFSDLGLYRLSDCFSSINRPHADNCVHSVPLTNEIDVTYSSDSFQHSSSHINNIVSSNKGRVNNRNIFCVPKSTVSQHKGNSVKSNIIEDIVMCELQKLSIQCPFFSAGLCCQSNSEDFVSSYEQMYICNTSYEKVSDNRTFSAKEDCCENSQVIGLRFLSLSGCYQITDNGLKYLAGSGVFMHLKHLDMSGCWNLTGPGLNSVIALCTSLQPENLYYCDHIENGPYCDTANGCQNLESEVRVCCCSGQ